MHESWWELKNHVFARPVCFKIVCLFVGCNLTCSAYFFVFESLNSSLDESSWIVVSFCAICASMFFCLVEQSCNFALNFSPAWLASRNFALCEEKYRSQSKGTLYNKQSLNTYRFAVVFFKITKKLSGIFGHFTSAWWRNRLQLPECISLQSLLCRLISRMGDSSQKTILNTITCLEAFYWVTLRWQTHFRIYFHKFDLKMTPAINYHKFNLISQTNESHEVLEWLWLHLSISF